MSQSKLSAPDFDIFLSYSRKDIDTMHRIKRDLETQGFRVWIDETGLPPGTSDWEIEIEGAIENVKCLMVLFSPDAKKSSWVRSAIRYAEHHNKPIFGLLVRGNDDSAIPLGHLNSQYISQYVDIRSAREYEPNLRSLMQTIGDRIGIEPRFVSEAHEAERDTQREGEEALKQRRDERGKVQVRQQWMMVGGGIGLLAVIGLVVLLTGVLGGGDDARTPATPTVDPVVVEAAQAGVESNREWEPYMQEFDGVPMALVPVGCFEMGSEDGDSDEQPVETICIEEPFWIDVYEVTNEQYGAGWCSDTSSAPNQPRNCVDWFEANAHCKDRGGRLPTEAEWEYAARGPDNLVYPWGNEWNPDNANWGDTSPDRTFAVGSFSEGASWVGALDMSGNVREWTNSLYEDYPYDGEDGREADTSDRINVRGVLRGGSFGSSASLLRSADRSGGSTDFAYFYEGFRCARSQ